jgi:flagellar biosynthesis chaperone FliJ
MMDEQPCEKHGSGKIVRECPDCRREAFLEMHDLADAHIKETDDRISLGLEVLDAAEQQLKMLRKKKREYERMKEELNHKNPDLVKYLY